MKIRFYGRLGEKLGREIDIDLPGGANSVSQLRNILAERFPEASTELLERTRACVADTIVGEAYRLADSNTVEFFPPLSGG